MTLYEYSCGEGLKEVLNFIWNYETGLPETDDAIFTRLGYREQPARIYSSGFANWMRIYRNFGNNEYDFILEICNHLYSQYIACKTFVEFLEFMRIYLPVLRTMNEIALATAGSPAVADRTT